MKKLIIGTLCIAAVAQFAIAQEADAGVQTVAKVQATPPQQVEAKTAKEKVMKALDKTFGGRAKWLANKPTRKITVVDVTYNMENPVTEEKLFTIRDTLSQRALLKAKVKLAESMSVEADADQSSIENPDENDSNKVTKTFKSAIKLMTKNPQTVFGATVLNQAESFENGVYHLASAVAWSEGLKNGAVEFLTSDKPSRKVDEDKDAEYIVDWLAKNDLATMCGPRQVIAPSGERYFLGISSRGIGSNAEISATNTRLAQLYAIQALLFSLYSDVSFADAAEIVDRKITAGGENGITQGKAMETLHENISVKAKKVLRGLGEIYGDEAVHPVSGRKMYVSVYAISASKAAKAKQFSADIAALRAKVARVDSAERAYNQGLRDAINAAENDHAAAQKANADAKKAVESRLNPSSMLPAAGGDNAQKPAKPNAPKKGVFGGDEKIDVNIL